VGERCKQTLIDNADDRCMSFIAISGDAFRDSFRKVSHGSM